MPKNAIDWKTREVSFYKFICQNEEIISSYVGHTVAFDKRKGQHKGNCNNPNSKNYNCLIYQTIREHGGWGNWRMIEIESRFVKDKREAERIEQDYIDKLKADMNTNKSFGAETIEEYNKEYQKQYCIENADKLKEQKRQYRIENADKLKEQKRQYRIENADKLKEQQKQYCIKNADKLKEQKRQYHIKNADKLKEHNKQYRIENADKIKEQKRQAYQKKKEQAKLNASPL